MKRRAREIRIRPLADEEGGGYLATLPELPWRDPAGSFGERPGRDHLLDRGGAGDGPDSAAAAAAGGVSCRGVGYAAFGLFCSAREKRGQHLLSPVRRGWAIPPPGKIYTVPNFCP